MLFVEVFGLVFLSIEVCGCRLSRALNGLNGVFDVNRFFYTFYLLIFFKSLLFASQFAYRRSTFEI